MADDVREKARRERSAGREERRELVTQPFEELEENRDGESGGGSAALRRAAATAAVTAVVGGLAGAAKALLERREAQDEPVDEEVAPEHSDDDPGAEHDDEPGAEHDDDLVAEGDEEPAPEEENDVEEEEHDAEEEGAGNEARAVPTGEIGDVIRNARAQLAQLLGSEPERISGARRSDDGWVVTLEVVEVRRIPDSTDILCSYELVLDDDGNLVSLERGRRYRRSQVEDS